MAKAVWNNQVLAESDEYLIIEGNIYFPPDKINHKFFKPSEHNSQCMWKGSAKYYNIEVNGEVNENAAWFYPDPQDGSTELVAAKNNGKGNFANYVAFWKGVTVTE